MKAAKKKTGANKPRRKNTSKKVIQLKSVTLAPEMRGANSTFRDEYVEQARAMCQLGATDRDLADYFEVTTVTIWRWQSRFKEFSAALQRGKEAADDRVERSLYARATGYTYDSEKILNVDGEIHRIKTLEHVPPDVTACIFWLKNRRSSEWRDKTDHDHTHAHKLTLQGGDMSVEDAQAMFRKARTLSPAELERSFKVIDGKVIDKSDA